MKTLIAIFLFLILAPPVYAQTCVQADLTHPLQTVGVWKDNSTDETGFVLERKLNNGAYSVIASSIAANITTYTDLSVVRDPVVANTYTYRLKAIKTLPDGTVLSSTYTNESCVTFAPNPPAAPLPPTPPTGFTVSAASATSIQASWSDNSDNETGFRLDFTSYSPRRAFSKTAGPDATSLLISGLQKNKTVCGKIVAVNLGGESDMSNQSCATPR